MCEDDCNMLPAPSTGDLVAVIRIGFENNHNSDSLPPSAPSADWRLRLSNSRVVAQGETEVLFDVKPDWWQSPLNLLIHEYGVLRGGPYPRHMKASENIITKNPIMYQFVLDPGMTKVSTAGMILGFDVSPTGIIGRAISVESEGKVVGEGIIGWL